MSLITVNGAQMTQREYEAFVERKGNLRPLTDNTIKQKVRRAARMLLMSRGDRVKFEVIQKRLLDPRGPTGHNPGSEGKIKVLQERVAMQVALFHPQDSTGIEGD